MIFADFKTYLIREKHLSTTSAYFYLFDVSQFFNFIRKDICHTAEEDVLKFIEYLNNKNMKPRTVERKICSLTAFFRWTTRSGRTKKMPIRMNAKQQRADIKPPKLKPVERPLLTEEQTVSLLNSIYEQSVEFKSRNLLMYKLMLFRGLKPDEIRNAMTDDIDWKNKKMKIHRKKTTISTVPKTYTIDIAAFIDELEEYVDNAYPVRLENKILFPNIFGGRISQRTMHRDISRFSEKIGIHLSLIDLRYNFAANRIKFEELEHLCKRLGHARIDVTVRSLRKDISELPRITDIKDFK